MYHNHTRRASQIYKIDGKGITEKSLRILKNMIEANEIQPECFTKATLNYDNASGRLPDYDTDECYSLKFISKDVEVWISSVTSGYCGEGPNGTLKALRMMGFTVDEVVEDIVFNKPVTDETFYK